MSPSFTRGLALVVLLLAACFSEEKRLVADMKKAQVEIFQTLKVPTSIHVEGEDLSVARKVTVKVMGQPPGLTREQIERNVNIVLHRYVPRLEQVEVVLVPGPGH